MSYVFDAGSILLLTRELGRSVVKIVENNLTADLAFYEIGNVLWKECRLLRRLESSEALKTLGFIRELMGIMKVLDVKIAGLGDDVLANAIKLRITYYDSVYLTLAKRFKAVLVTDDQELTRASGKLGVKTLVSEDLVG